MVPMVHFLNFLYSVIYEIGPTHVCFSIFNWLITHAESEFDETSRPHVFCTIILCYRICLSFSLVKERDNSSSVHGGLLEKSISFFEAHFDTFVKNS